MKPRYEIHSIGMPEIVEPVARGQEENRDRAARALFSATELVSTNRFETEIGRTAPQAKYTVYMAQYQNRLQTQLNALAESANKIYRENPAAGDIKSVIEKLDPAERRDSWGSALHFDVIGNRSYLAVRSAGPDKKLNTADDEVGYMLASTRRVFNAAAPGDGRIVLEHDRGPFNGRAELIGTVVDPAGAVVAGARVEAKNLDTGVVFTATTGPRGQFSITALPPSSYSITVTVAGFQMWTGRATLDARDRAVVSLSLAVGAVTDSVTVTGAVPFAVNGVGVIGGIAGGFGGGGGRGGAVRAIGAAPPPMAQAPLLKTESGVLEKEMSLDKVALTIGTGNAPAAPAAHVRSYFPEALYINPEIITDKDGRASIEIPLADSITTWRMAMLASTAKGALGSGTSSIKVFQDFFVDLDLPVTLTQGDRVSVPVAVYNYSGSNGDARLELHPDDWFSLISDTGTKTVAAESGRVGSAQFTIEAKRIGKFKLTLSASMKGGADIVVREIEVVPNGREQTEVFNGRLDSSVEHHVNFPATAIADASKLFVRLYPGPLSQIVEGMDAILRMPGGCFEQTSSSTYPNVLALDYMKSTKKLTPEVHAKAEGFIVSGYQRLLTFEVPGGGFSWFGQAPANKILTSYGLMEFSDMSKVHEVDPKLIQRTQQWLASQQQPDGSWKPDTGFINEGATNRFNKDVLRISAYIAWALENTGYKGPAVERAKQFVAQHCRREGGLVHTGGAGQLRDGLRKGS